MKSWLAGGFNQKVINRIMELVDNCQAGPMTIYVTGMLL